MNINAEILKHMPASLQIWQRIEEEAHQRAEKRFQEMVKNNVTVVSGKQNS